MRRILPVLAVAAFAGCSDSIVEVTRAPAPSLSVSSSSARSKYVVLFRGGAPSDFESSVVARGGTVELLHHGSGIAIVDGLSADGARAIQANVGVEAIIQDFEYQGVSHQLEPAVEAADAAMLDVGMQSQANPATAFLYVIPRERRRTSNTASSSDL